MPTDCKHENLRHIETAQDDFSCIRYASWCEDCGALHDGIWRLPKRAQVVDTREMKGATGP